MHSRFQSLDFESDACDDTLFESCAAPLLYYCVPSLSLTFDFYHVAMMSLCSDGIWIS